MPAPDATTATQWLSAAGLEKQAIRYLGLAGGAPGRVVQWKAQGQLAPIDAVIESLRDPPADPLVLAGRWDGLLKGDGLFRMEHLVEGIQRWVFDLAQERLGGRVHYHHGWNRPKNVSQLDPETLFGAWRELGQFRRSARHPLNQLLFLESLATHTLRALRPAG